MLVGLPTFHEAGEQGDVGRFPPSGRQLHADPLKLVPQHLSSVLRLGPARKKKKKG